MWDEIARSGEDTVAVARASYGTGGNARHRFHAVAWLTFDARFSAEAREFAVELLDDRSSKVVEVASRALAWGWDVTLLSRCGKQPSERTGRSVPTLRPRLPRLKPGIRTCSSIARAVDAFT